MSNHSVIEHRANYHFIKLEEDYLQICGDGDEYPHCKAFILSVLEHWMNDKLAKGQDGYVYMSYPQWIEAMYGLFHRNHIIKCLSELVADGLIFKRPYTYQGRDSFAYCLNVQEVQKRLSALEERTEKYTRPNIHPFKFKRIQIQTGTDLKINGEPATRIQIQTGTPFKNKRNIDSSTKNLLHKDTNKDIGVSAHASTPSSPALSAEKEIIQDAVVEVAVSPPVQSSPVAPVPVVVELPVDALTVQATSTRQAAKNKEKSPKPKPMPEDEALTARCKAIQAKVNELRGFKLKKTGLIIDESKVIREHLAREDFSNERIERIHSWIVTNIWKYKSVGGRGDVGARVIWEESGRAEAVIVPPVTTHATTGYLGAPIAWGTPGYNFADEFYPSEAEKRMMYAAHSTIQ